MDGLNLVINITDRDKSETAIRLFQENGVFTTDVALGQGTAPREILEYLYLSPAEKAIIFGVVTNAGLSSLFKTLKRRMYIDVPGNGIAVTIPLSSIGGRRSLEYMLDGQVLGTNKSLEKAERIERMSIKTDYELIFCSRERRLQRYDYGCGTRRGRGRRHCDQGKRNRGGIHRKILRIFDCFRKRNTPAGYAGAGAKCHHESDYGAGGT